MYQIIEQTNEEKMAMYMKLSKKELAQMLITANEYLTARPITITQPANTVNPYWCIFDPATGKNPYDITFDGTSPITLTHIQ